MPWSNSKNGRKIPAKAVLLNPKLFKGLTSTSELIFNFHPLKGVFTKNVEKYLIVIAANPTSICCLYKEKIIKNDSTHTEDHNFHTSSES